MKKLAFALLLIPFLSVLAGIDEPLPVLRPSPTPVIINEGTLVDFGNSVVAAKNITLGIYEAYKVDGAWGYGITAGYPLGKYFFVGLRLDALAGNWYAGSATAGAKYQFDFGGFKPTIFGLTGVNSPISGAGSKDQSVGAILGAGAYVPLWQSKDKDHRFTFGVFAEGEDWTQYGKVLLVHGGVWGNYHF